ncbi:unnamed protein product, partial [Prorocentrum cordatum]
EETPEPTPRGSARARLAGAAGGGGAGAAGARGSPVRGEPPPRPPAAAADGGFASNGRASGGRGASRAGAALRLQRWWRDCLEARGALFEGLVVELMELRAGAAEDTGGPAGVARLHPEAAGPRRSGVAGVTAARRPRDGAVVPARPSRSDAVAARLPLALGSLCLLSSSSSSSSSSPSPSPSCPTEEAGGHVCFQLPGIAKAWLLLRRAFVHAVRSDSRR